MRDLVLQSLEPLVKNGVKGFVGFIVLWFIGNFLSRLIRKNIVLQNHHQGVVIGLARTIKYICVFLGVIVFLKELGVDLHGAVTGLGLTGVAFSFALKDTFSNVVAGAFILLYRPFHLGDNIIISSDKLIAEGTVQTIDFRYTTLKTEKGLMLVPNSVLYLNSITLKKS